METFDIIYWDFFFLLSKTLFWVNSVTTLDIWNVSFKSGWGDSRTESAGERHGLLTYRRGRLYAAGESGFTQLGWCCITNRLCPLVLNAAWEWWCVLSLSPSLPLSLSLPLSTPRMDRSPGVMGWGAWMDGWREGRRSVDQGSLLNCVFLKGGDGETEAKTQAPLPALRGEEPPPEMEGWIDGMEEAQSSVGADRVMERQCAKQNTRTLPFWNLTSRWRERRLLFHIHHTWRKKPWFL